MVSLLPTSSDIVQFQRTSFQRTVALILHLHNKKNASRQLGTEEVYIRITYHQDEFPQSLVSMEDIKLEHSHVPNTMQLANYWSVHPQIPALMPWGDTRWRHCSFHPKCF